MQRAERTSYMKCIFICVNWCFQYFYTELRLILKRMKENTVQMNYQSQSLFAIHGLVGK